ncbi:MAG: RluA family pseudouridine synthase [Clostridia bacterium]|nr:RluA family pseudouridine synthase [Clostridia bacterium]
MIVEESGQRIDKYIAENQGISRVAVQRLIEEGNILVNGEITKPSYLVQAGNEVTIQMPKVKETDLKPQKIPLDIIYEDDDIIVINKAKGMVVHPAAGNPDGTLVNAIMAHCKGNLSGIGGELRPGIVHRLDKDTSGILIIAKNDKAHLQISEQIQNREVKKIYLALVRGIVPEDEATIKMPIGRSTKDRKKMAVTPKGKEAITHFKVLERFEKYTYLEVKIETGRTHQIRVHMSEIGHPVVGDMVYSNGKNEFNIEGQMLHAHRLEFKHPITEKDMRLEAPLPEYFANIISDLRNRGK